MKMLRSALIGLLLMLAQWATLTHAVEHLRTDQGGHVPHSACVQCLSAHGLDSSLVTAPVLAPLCSAEQALPEAAPFYSAERFLVFRHARAPPFA